MNASHVSKYQVERPRHSGEIKRLDEQTRVSDLPSAAATHEAPKLLLMGPSLPRRLLLERAEGTKLSLGVNDLFHGGGTQSADQLVLQVRDAHVEAQRFHLDASEVGAESGSRETASEVALLCGVTKTRQPHVEPLRTEQTQEASYGLRSPDRHHCDALNVKVAAAALGERLHRALVADPFDEHDRTRVGGCGQRMCCGNGWSIPTLHSEIVEAVTGSACRREDLLRHDAADLDDDVGWEVRALGGRAQGVW